MEQVYLNMSHIPILLSSFLCFFWGTSFSDTSPFLRSCLRYSFLLPCNHCPVLPLATSSQALPRIRPVWVLFTQCSQSMDRQHGHHFLGSLLEKVGSQVPPWSNESESAFYQEREVINVSLKCEKHLYTCICSLCITEHLKKPLIVILN